MTETGPPALALRYSRRGQFLYWAGALVLGYGGFGMLMGTIPVGADQRLQQVLIGTGFAVFALALGIAALGMLAAAGRPVVDLDAGGLWDRRLTAAPIPWTAIDRIVAVEPGFLERFVLPGGLRGRLFVCLAAGAASSFGPPPFRLSPARLFSRPGRLRLFHRSLDLPYPILVAALDRFTVVERRT